MSQVIGRTDQRTYIGLNKKYSAQYLTMVI